tara:strand:+ start:157 stop:333 length:177 start_codon:yes stop_codon:yes gene_type:complete
MARKPNYKFERLQRERNKAAKKEARRQAKEERAAQRKAEEEGVQPSAPDVGEPESGIE